MNDVIDKTTGSQMAAVHEKARDELLKYYQTMGTFDGKILGVFDKPVPKLPPFVPHSTRLFLVWSASILVFVALYLAVVVLWQLWHGKHANQSEQETEIAEKVELFQAATNEMDKDLARKFVLATNLQNDRAVNYYFDSKFTTTLWPPPDCVQRAADVEKNLKKLDKQRRNWNVFRVIALAVICYYIYTAFESVLNSDAFAVLGIPTGSSAAMAKRAFRRLAKEVHPDTGADGLSSADRLHVLATARDEIVRGIAAPLALALPELSDNSMLAMYFVLLFSVAASAFAASKYMGVSDVAVCGWRPNSCQYSDLTRLHVVSDARPLAPTPVQQQRKGVVTLSDYSVDDSVYDDDDDDDRGYNGEPLQ